MPMAHRIRHIKTKNRNPQWITYGGKMMKTDVSFLKMAKEIAWFLMFIPIAVATKLFLVLFFFLRTPLSWMMDTSKIEEKLDAMFVSPDPLWESEVYYEDSKK